MVAVLYGIGFDVDDITMKDIIDNNEFSFDIYNGIVFVGGFTYSDVLGSAEGWFQIINSNQNSKKSTAEGIYNSLANMADKLIAMPVGQQYSLTILI